jgi:Fe2+ transport system protein B
MNIVVLSIVGTPLLVGMGLLIWGLRSMRHRRMLRAETFPYGPCRNRMGIGCLFVGWFFPLELVVARVPLGLEVAIVVVFSLLLIIVGEFVIRSALVSLRAVPPGLPWLVFLGWSCCLSCPY